MRRYVAWVEATFAAIEGIEGQPTHGLNAYVVDVSEADLAQFHDSTDAPLGALLMTLLGRSMADDGRPLLDVSGRVVYYTLAAWQRLVPSGRHGPIVPADPEAYSRWWGAVTRRGLLAAAEAEQQDRIRQNGHAHHPYP